VHHQYRYGNLQEIVQMKNLSRFLSKTVVVLAAIVAGSIAFATENIVYLHNDATGTPLMATDSSGNVLWKENYRPYGEKLNNQPASANNRIWFAGKPYDQNTGLSYMGARYYDPMLGRFVGVDPVGVKEENIHSFNRYAYANDNPYKFVDPDGRSPLLVLLPVVMTPMAVGAMIGGGMNAADQYFSTGTVRFGGLGGVIDAAGDGATFGLLGVSGAASVARAGSAGAEGAKGGSKADAVIAETLAGKGNLTSQHMLKADELLMAGEKFLGQGYKEIGKPGSGVFRSADGTRQFRIDGNSLSGNHAPGIPHGHLETYAPSAAKPLTNNHIPFVD
jgi:RHS repeat-associated protein